MTRPQTIHQVPLEEARGSFEEILSQAETGAMIEIIREGKVVARIVPGNDSAPPVRRPRHPGFARGEVEIGEDFDEPLGDFVEHQ